MTTLAQASHLQAQTAGRIADLAPLAYFPWLLPADLVRYHSLLPFPSLPIRPHLPAYHSFPPLLLSLQKRAALLASGHVSTGQVPSIEDANSREQILMPPSACHPRVVFGCSLDEALAAAASSAGRSTDSSSNGSGSSSEAAHSQQQQEQQLAELVGLYAGERYLLTWQDGTAWVALLEGAERQDMLRAMWQAAWLDHHLASPADAAGRGAGSSSNGSGPPALAHAVSHGSLLGASLAALRQQWPDFEAQAAAQGWELDRAVLPQGQTRLRLE